MTTAEREVREPKQDRSRATRQRLLQAAITVLARDGWDNATVANIAAQAGISRGAAQHHFPTREDLNFAALDYIFERRREAISTLETDLQGPDRQRRAVSVLIEYYADDFFKAALQVWTAAAADDALRDRLVPLERRLGRGTHEMAVRLLDADDSDPATHRLIQATLDLARGLGLADVLTDDSRRRRQIAAEWGAVLEASIKTLP
ncbi:TetR/AcrR family transcriptional regulator [Branchiibius cervicis]|uniref:TetR/AcrR family transcriptional regulator n=1 Tax=Branchiibius cervicis TaxID=908252 RepID=A0ABW2AVW5_9MICO